MKNLMHGTAASSGLSKTMARLACLALVMGISIWGGTGAAEAAEAAGSLSGRVTTNDGTPAVDARVTVIELDRSVYSDSEGRYRFDRLPSGELHVVASRAGLGSVVVEVTVEGETTADLTLDVKSHREQIVVTASRRGRGTAEVVQPVDVIDKTELEEKMRPTIGETLADQPGVSSTYFGPGSSRPVIRGQGGSRIRVLEGGLGVGDASTTSPDHAVSTDLAVAERVEILRGPSTLLYGSSAVGGVVNVIDRRVPEYIPANPVEGSLRLRQGSVDDETTAALSLDGGQGQFAWHVAGFTRDTNDVEVPGRAIANDPDSPDGVLENSSLESEGGTVGFSWVGDKGFVGVSARVFDTNYGIPAELEEDGTGEEEEAGIRIDLNQRRYDLRGGIDVDWGRFDHVNFTAGLTDYDHKELEGSEIGTVFFNESYESRVEFLHGSGTSTSGVIGLQFGNRDFEAIGDEAFVPPSETDSLALFALQQFGGGSDVRYEVGLRFETQDVSTVGGALDRDFDGVSASGGLIWSPGETYALGVSLARTERFPTAEELFSDGPHLATFAFELGDPNLEEETGLGLDVSFRKLVGKVTGQVSLFATRYDDFIFEAPTGDMDDGLPVFQFMQDDAEYFGLEVDGAVEVMRSGAHHVDVEFVGDWVRAELRETGDPLPRIPPLSASLGASYHGPRWYSSAFLRYTGEQDEVAAFETETDDFTMIDASLGYRIVTGDVVHKISLRGRNLSDQEGRNHVSQLKDLILLPGRDISIGYEVTF